MPINLNLFLFIFLLLLILVLLILVFLYVGSISEVFRIYFRVSSDLFPTSGFVSEFHSLPFAVSEMQSFSPCFL